MLKNILQLNNQILIMLTVLANSTRFFEDEKIQWEVVGEGVQTSNCGGFG
jgi:hypothetical protein